MKTIDEVDAEIAEHTLIIMSRFSAGGSRP
jgi:hypothetical protein